MKKTFKMIALVLFALVSFTFCKTYDSNENSSSENQTVEENQDDKTSETDSSKSDDNNSENEKESGSDKNKDDATEDDTNEPSVDNADDDSEKEDDTKNVEINSSSVKNQSVGLEDLWWKKTAFYHIWIYSFSDSDGNGGGDFKGIENKLDYIKNDLGCDGIWLSPFFSCDNHGYDVNNYYKVNEYYGSENDLESLINACHERGIKIIFDFIPNHTGSGHQWFKDSCNNVNGKKDWYVWNDEKLYWNPMGNSDTWHKNPNGNDYYYAAFSSDMPDLNYKNSEVREEMKNVVRYWLNKGFDGLRVDAVRYLIETENAPYDTDETHEYFQELRRDVIDEYKNQNLSPKFMTCESWIENDRNTLKKYFGTDENPEFNIVFDFAQGKGMVNAVKNSEKSSLSVLETNPDANRAYGTFIANHDGYIDRIGTLFEGYIPKEKILTSISLLRPTVPFIYYGTEIGMKNDSATSGDYEPKRGKFEWNEAEKQKAESSSILNMNKALLSIRKTYPNLFADGTLEFLENDRGKKSVVAYTISDETDTILCVYNLNYSKSTISAAFKISSDLDISDYSVLVGTNIGKTLSLESDSLSIQGLSPCEVRVYYLGDGEKDVVFKNSTLSDEELELLPCDTLYLRGDFNNWQTDLKMTYAESENAFKISLNVAEDKTYQFKFDESGDWTTSYGSGEENENGKTVLLGEETKTSTQGGNNTNFAITLQNGETYIFTFKTETETFTVTTVTKEN